MARNQNNRDACHDASLIVSPFVHHLNLTLADKIQIAIMSVTVAPIRVLMMIVSLFLLWLTCFIGLIGYSDRMFEPMSGWRKKWRWLAYYLVRAVTFSVGYHHIRVVRPKQDSNQLRGGVVAPIVVAAPHSSFFDAVIIYACNSFPCGVSRIENENIPILGSIVRFTQPVSVVREDPESRQKTIAEINRRASSNGQWPQIVIFPEGTCSSHSCFITFKPGAFVSGEPVQPVVIKQQNKMNTVIWTWDGPNAYAVLWLTLCQFKTSATLEMLPIYYPNDAEKADAKLFANNVRAKMAECLGVPTIDYGFEDCRLMLYTAKLKLPISVRLVEFQKLSVKLKLKYENFKDTMNELCEISKNCSCRGITVKEFAQYLKVPVTNDLEALFKLYDHDDSRTIDFREYVIGLHIVFCPFDQQGTLRLAFQLFDHCDKGYLISSEFCCLLKKVFGVESTCEAETLFNELDKNQDGQISFADFAACASKKPAYARFFMSYYELMATTDSTKDRDCFVKTNGLPTKNKSD